MRTLLLGILTLWTLLVAPTLCVGGIVEHACGDCTEISCSHEQDCLDDPCNEAMLRVVPLALDDVVAAPVGIVANDLLSAPMRPHKPLLQNPFPPEYNVQLYASDLPLLI